jgi:threonine dehydrogenase-like Zn-dependent dehydrogenase
VLVVGGGTVGLLIAGLAARIAGTTVTVTDVAASRADVAVLLGARFALPAEAPGDQDVAVSASATDVGLKLALERAGRESRVVEASWHGDRTAALPLGEAFHARRLQLISSQVGSIPADHAARWTNRRRLATALELLRDPAYDALIEEEIPFEEAPRRLPAVLAKPGGGLMTLLRYD